MERYPEPWDIWWIRYPDGSRTVHKMMVVVCFETDVYGAWQACGFLVNTDRRTDYLGEENTEVCDVPMPHGLHGYLLDHDSWINCGRYYRCPYSQVLKPAGTVHRKIRQPVLDAIKACEILKPIEKTKITESLVIVMESDGS